MKALLSSRITTIVVSIIGFFAAVLLVQSISWQYYYYTNQVFNSGVSPSSDLLTLILIFLFLLCVVIFLYSVWGSRSPRAGKEPRFWYRFDYLLLLVLTFSIFLLCASAMNAYARYYNPALLLLFSAIAYLAVMLFLAETVIRIRDKQIRQTLYWLSFFKQYPVKRLVGFLMALLLTINLLFIFIIFPVTIRSNQLGALTYIFSVVTLIALTYFCTFVLSLSAEYERSNAEKIQAERLKTELITNVSHDIRTPLTSIINYVDLLKALPIENDEFANYVGVLDKKSIRLKCLIDDLMEASKAGTGNLTVTMEELDLVEIVGQVAGDFDERFVERHLVLVFPQPEQPVTVRADSRHLSRVLENLFKNITKYALQGTRVFVEVTARDGRPTIALRNTSQDPIFLPSDALTEQFIRGDRSRQTEGNGLGLYIAKGLMESMGGGLSIRTIGDLFEVTLRFG